VCWFRFSFSFCAFVVFPILCFPGLAFVSVLFAFFMATLCNRAGHICFHAVVSSPFFFFPRLISVVGDWMSTILPHMVWP